ncbi:hypothetical protein DSO57_1003847 [Entomophthora muscae]|uniref:Uncharacterized protein n=1 Tax=Entomophthora muscae TaxID=34485 RepID=A0ACC2UTV2_9FUNG|nr:hypothetical protein DSO57_1003847 [Entomophthora muscae]
MLLQDWYRPTEGLVPAEVQVYGGDACLVIERVLEEFTVMQAKYKLWTSHLPLLENDNFSKPVPGYDPGHTLRTGGQDPTAIQKLPLWDLGRANRRSGREGAKLLWLIAGAHCNAGVNHWKFFENIGHLVEINVAQHNDVGEAQDFAPQVLLDQLEE